MTSTQKHPQSQSQSITLEPYSPNDPTVPPSTSISTARRSLARSSVFHCRILLSAPSTNSARNISESIGSGIYQSRYSPRTNICTTYDGSAPTQFQKAVGYWGTKITDVLLGKTKGSYFMNVNTSIKVEHLAMECVGVDMTRYCFAVQDVPKIIVDLNDEHQNHNVTHLQTGNSIYRQADECKA